MSIGCTFFSFSQKTIQFADPQPSGLPFQTSVEKNHFGVYKSNETNTKYVVDDNGISIVSLVISYVTRAQVRESSTLQVRGNYLFGIKGNDSLPCVIDGEKYYYGIESRLVVIGDGSLNRLVKVAPNKYIINFHEGMYFEPSLLEFDQQGMSIIHGELTYQQAFSTAIQVNTITRYGSEVLVLAPNQQQWNGFEKALFSGEKLGYQRITD